MQGKNLKMFIEKGLRGLGLVPSEWQVNAFVLYLRELKKWNRAYNLTALKTDEDIIIKHFLDSLLYLRAMPEGKIKVADIGSGAGFPGIPMKIVRPEVEMYLIEPSRKKAAFLRHVIRIVGLEEIEVIEKRLEDMRAVEESLSSVDVAVTRALFDIEEFIKKAAPILKQNGLFILSKGPKIKDELKALVGKSYDMLTLSLPLAPDIKRNIVIIKCE